MLLRSPARNTPVVITLVVKGERLRDRMVWSASTTCEAVTMASIPRWGEAPWACRPMTRAVHLVDAAIAGPGVNDTCPSCWSLPSASGGDPLAWKAKIIWGLG